MAAVAREESTKGGGTAAVPQREGSGRCWPLGGPLGVHFAHSARDMHIQDPFSISRAECVRETGRVCVHRLTDGGNARQRAPRGVAAGCGCLTEYFGCEIDKRVW